MLRFMVAGALAAFVVSGPLQHAGVLPQTVVGDLSKQAIKSVLGITAKDAFAGCRGEGGGFGGGKHGDKHGGKDFGGDKHGNKKGKKHDRDD